MNCKIMPAYIHELFQLCVIQNFNQTAVVLDNERLTYRELNRQANQLARYLGKLGVEPEVVVGLCMERSPTMVVALLGILKAGGAYFPLDPTYPKERLAFMIQDARASIVLTRTQHLKKLPRCNAKIACLTVLDLPTTFWHQLCLELNRERWAIPDSLRLAIIGGERARPQKLEIGKKHVNPQVRLVNTYGPTAAILILKKNQIKFSCLNREVVSNHHFLTNNYHPTLEIDRFLKICP
jgi:non-ribosomal peptide synthetase component F